MRSQDYYLMWELFDITLWTFEPCFQNITKVKYVSKNNCFVFYNTYFPYSISSVYNM